MEEEEEEYKMSETISLEVRKKVPKKILRKIYSKINPVYVKALLADNGMPIDRYTKNIVTTSYKSFPTQDLALRAYETENGIKFFGIASGSGAREERVAIKYLILEYIQDELSKAGIKSDINIADLNRETIEYMKSKGIFKNKLKELRGIVRRKGNLENIMLGAYSGFSTPV